MHWDEPLEESLQKRWNIIVKEIRDATELVIPRQYLPSLQFSAQELHVFADTSMKAYGAVVYFKQDAYTSLKQGCHLSRPYHYLDWS